MLDDSGILVGEEAWEEEQTARETLRYPGTSPLHKARRPRKEDDMKYYEIELGIYVYCLVEAADEREVSLVLENVIQLNLYSSSHLKWCKEAATPTLRREVSMIKANSLAKRPTSPSPKAVDPLVISSAGNRDRRNQNSCPGPRARDLHFY